MSYLTPDDAIPGAYRVLFGRTQQSWVDPDRPDFLLFEYVQHIAIVLDHTVLGLPEEQRIRIVHIGGGGLSIPRWVEWRRPHTAQVVCEPNTDLTDEVRRKIPLGRHSGIKVRDVDGRTGLAAMPDGWADVVILDAFDGARVPKDLVTAEAFDEIRRVVRGEGVLITNVTDLAPFSWSKRVAAGIAERWSNVIVGAEPAVHKGRRFGNLLLVGSVGRLDVHGIKRATAPLPIAYRWLSGRDALAWPGGAAPFTDDDTDSSPRPVGSKLWF
ncbi:MAG: fused MFS/spermidine synthase [Propionibacterium sp.]|nr:fused MFS/spermidine synthase [Propionibacterium sp.]